LNNFIVNLRDILSGMTDFGKLLSFSILILTLAGCSGYEKILKSNDYKLKYKTALSYYYEKEDYVRAGTLFDQIAAVFRGTDQADTIYYLQAMSYFKQSDYILSGHYFRTFAATYGGSPFVEQADFMGAYCYYLLSPRPELDQTNTVQAIQAFQLYMIKYPGSEKSEEVKAFLAELRDKLVEKSYLSAKLYYNLEDYKASMVALTNSLIAYPDNKYREEIMFMLVKSSYMFAEKSVSSKKKERFQDAVDEYYSFAAEFPESRFIKEAKRYYRLSAKYLGNDSIEKESSTDN
jgi:outer membrane protein assembly factor BamD